MNTGSCQHVHEWGQGDLLAGTEQSMYLQETMAFSIQGPLALKHILVLLWVYVLIWEEYWQAFQAELHSSVYAPPGPKSVYIKWPLNFVDLTALLPDPTLFGMKASRYARFST